MMQDYQAGSRRRPAGWTRERDGSSLTDRHARVPAPVSLAIMFAALLSMAGCTAKESRFEIADYRAEGNINSYHEVFSEGYYTTEADGDLRIVFRRQEPSRDDARELISQIVCISTFWRSQPGRTIADSTQINGTVRYAIIGPGGGTTYEGTGSVFFDENKDGDELEGSLDLALLSPVRELREGQPLFEKAELSGEFHAIRNRQKVIRITNELGRLFGSRKSDSNQR
ncbi:MAG: hypothetical protein ACPGXK_10405 [Phycisphaerae bacterium]